MKLKSMMVAALAALTFASCSDDDGNKGVTGGNFDMYMQMDIAAATRAAVDYEVSDGDLTTFNNGAIFFTKNDADETIVRMVIVSDNNQAGTVTATQLANGYLFKDVNESAVKVHIVGNKDFNGSTYASMKEVRNVTVDVTDQKDNDYGISRVTLYGAAPITAVPATPATADETAAKNAGADRMAVAEISPIMARFEIDKISGDGTNAAGDASKVDEFTVAGIYINNYYFKVGVTGEPGSQPLIHNSLPVEDLVAGITGWPNKYEQYARTTATPTPGQYDPAWGGLLFDDAVFGTTAALSHKPSDVGDASLVTWAYNVFADGSAVPHIVIHLENVKVDGAAYDNQTITGASGRAYLTVTGYYTKATTADEPILGGNVYKMDDLKFHEDNLTDEPYGENEGRDKVWVKVTVKPWKVRHVDPNFN